MLLFDQGWTGDEMGKGEKMERKTFFLEEKKYINKTDHQSKDILSFLGVEI